MQRSTLFFLVGYHFCIRYFSKTMRKPAKKITGQCCSTEMEVACENSANLEQETKTTKIVTYPLFPLASSNDCSFSCCMREASNIMNATSEGLQHELDGLHGLLTIIITSLLQPSQCNQKCLCCKIKVKEESKFYRRGKALFYKRVSEVQ